MRCSLGHDHVYAGTCERDGCERCHADCDERQCDIGSFVFDTAPDCRRTFLASDTADLTGFTTRAAAALVHLREAWCSADPSNRQNVALAIASLMATRSLGENPERYEFFLRFSLDDERADELIAECQQLQTHMAAAMIDYARSHPEVKITRGKR